MLNLIITPWFRILSADRDGAAELRQSLAAMTEFPCEREVAPEFPRASFSGEVRSAEMRLLAAVSRAS